MFNNKKLKSLEARIEQLEKQQSWTGKNIGELSSLTYFMHKKENSRCATRVNAAEGVKALLDFFKLNLTSVETKLEAKKRIE